MAEITSLEQILGAGAGGPLTQPTPWIWGPGFIYFPYGVVIGAPVGLNKGPGALNVKTLYIDGSLVNLGLYLPYTGGALTGMLTLYADPTVDMHASTKKYVDNKITVVNGYFASYLPLTGGTLTGPLVLPADPTVDLQASTKKYVDNKFTGLIGISDAPSDGNIYARLNGTWSNVYDAGTF